MRSLFTIFDAFWRIIPALGIVLGGLAGHRLFGPIGLVIGAILGLIIGSFLGKLPGNRMLIAIHRELKDKSDDDLRASLRSPDCKYPNITLLELNRRGVNISSELPVVLDMLEAEDIERRRKGVAAITSAFPGIADKVSDYKPTDTVDECRKKIQVLRNLTEQGAGGEA